MRVTEKGEGPGQSVRSMRAQPAGLRVAPQRSTKMGRKLRAKGKRWVSHLIGVAVGTLTGLLLALLGVTQSFPGWVFLILKGRGTVLGYHGKLMPRNLPYTENVYFFFSFTVDFSDRVVTSCR